MKPFFIDKFEYNFYANESLISLVKEQPSAYKDEIASLYSHILNAQQIWNERILKNQSKIDVWSVLELSELDVINQNVLAESISIVKTLNLQSDFSYKNSRGAVFQNKIEEVLYHIVNHGTYHRGQIITLLKQQGVSVVSTDYIFYKR